jgi:CPA1 family monovalent cation:H+ antiporter
LHFLQITSILIVLAGLFGAFNHFVLRLPSAIGILVVALMASLAVLVLDALAPGLGIADEARRVVGDIDFSDALLEGLLGLLLFAGALQLRLGDLRDEWLAVLLMATIGVALSTAIFGVGFSWVTGAPILMALVLGAILSPTDPVAVLGALRRANLPKPLESKIAGESLFNDGVAYVAFLLFVALAFPAPDAEVPYLGWALLLFLREAGGGIVLGLVAGWLVSRLLRRIDDPSLAVMLTLGLAFGGYELAVLLGVSAPLMAASAGLLVGEIGTREGRMSDETRDTMGAFWKLVDEILNAILFLLIGFEVFAVAFEGDFLVSSVAAIALSLAARFASVALPIVLVGRFRLVHRGTIPVMTWGGLKGGVSVALALSLPEGDWTPVILTATYVVVVFSIVVQGLTVAPLAARVIR